MASQGAKMGKGADGEDNSNKEWSGFKAKEGSVFPKRKKHVSTMMGEKIVEVVAAAVKNKKKNQKINPRDE